MSTKKANKNSREYYNLKPGEWAIVIGLLAIAFIAPYAITQLDWGPSFMETGQIGDTIGGLTAPFINLIAAFLVYKSFTAQIKANIDQRNSHNDEMKSIKEEQGINTIIHLFGTVRGFVLDNKSSFSVFINNSAAFKPQAKGLETTALLNHTYLGPLYKQYLQNITPALRTIKTNLVQIENLTDYINKHEIRYPNKAFGQLYRTKIKNLIVKLGYFELLNPSARIISYGEILTGEAHLEFRASKKIVERLALMLMDDGSGNPDHYN